MGIIYKLTSKTSGKSYIGSTSGTLNSRWLNHKKGLGGSPNLCAAIQENGEEDFERQIVAHDIEEEDLSLEEKKAIIAHGTLFPSGYNTPGSHVRPNREKLAQSHDNTKLERYSKMEIERIELHEVFGMAQTFIRAFIYETGKEKPSCVRFEYKTSKETTAEELYRSEERFKAFERALEFSTSVCGDVWVHHPKDVKMSKDVTKLPGERQNDETVDKAYLYYSTDRGRGRIGVFFQTRTKWLFDSKVRPESNMEKKFFYIKESMGYDAAFTQALIYARKHCDNVENMNKKHHELSEANLEPHPNLDLLSGTFMKSVNLFRTKNLDSEEVEEAIIKTTPGSVYIDFKTSTKHMSYGDRGVKRPRKGFECKDEDKLEETIKKAKLFASQFTDNVIDDTRR